MKKLLAALLLVAVLPAAVAVQSGWVTQNNAQSYITRNANSAYAVTITQQNTSACTLNLVSGSTSVWSLCGSTETLTGALNVTGNVGIGIVNPTWKLHVVGTNGSALIAIRRYGGVAQFVAERWAGTVAVPVAVTAPGNQVLELGGYVLTDTVAGQQNNFFVRSYLDGTGSSTSSPGDFQVWTTPEGSITALRRFRVNNLGRMSLGNYTGFGSTGINEAVKLGPLVDGTPMHVALLQNTAPTVTSGGGTSPSISGSDSAMTVTIGATGVPTTTIVVTFNAAWQAAPSCVVQMGKAGMVDGMRPLTVATTTTTATIVTNGTPPGNSDLYHVLCFGIQ